MLIYIFLLVLNLAFVTLKFGRYIGGGLSFIYIGFLAGRTDLVNNRDTFNYFNDYINLGNFGYNSRFEWAYVYSEKIGRAMNLTYPEYRTIFMLIIFGLFIWALTKFTHNLSMVYIFFALFNFPLEVTQVRNFAMFSFFLFALALNTKPTKLNKLLSLVFAYIGTGFHSTGYLFMFPIIIVVFFDRDNIERMTKYVWYASTGLAFIMPVLGSGWVGNVLSRLLGSVSGNAEAAENVRDRFNNDGSVVLSLVMAISFWIFYKAGDTLTKHSYDGDFAKKSWNTKLLNLSIAFTSLGIPLLQVSGQYQRVLRYGLLLIIIKMVASYVSETPSPVKGMLDKHTQIKNSDVMASMVMFVDYFMIVILFYGLYASRLFADTVPYLIQWR